ncbi:apolipoprotein N-acyltransferase [Thermodesulfobacteriota bacterium]
MKTRKLDRRKALFAAVSGILVTAAFPNISFSWLVWVSLVPLLIALRDLSVKDSFRIGLLGGFVHFLGLVYWVAFTMRTYGHLPLYLSLLILGLMAAYLALYWALFTAALAWLRPKPHSLVILAPLLWVVCEYLRSHLFTGFPWGLLGHTQYKALHLIQICDITGVYGLSFLIVLSNTALYMVLLHLAAKPWYGRPVGKWLAPSALLALGVLLSAVWLHGAWRIKNVDQQISQAPQSPVAVIQGNIDQSIKWDPAYQIITTNTYRKLSLSTKAEKPALVVWPETATPFYYLTNTRLTKLVQESIIDTGTYFLIGSPFFMRTAGRAAYYNSAYLIEPDGKVSGRYDKVHLVPYGEYIPLKRWLPFLGKIVAEVGDFSAGNKGNTLTWDQNRLGVLICYEAIFPGLARALVRNQADLLVNITNDAWFGRTSAAQQHFSMAVFRAVENRRALVRAANTGISGYIDPVGRILQTSPSFERRVMNRPVALMRLTTLYTRGGDIFALVCLIGALALGLRRLIAGRIKPAAKQ